MLGVIAVLNGIPLEDGFHVTYGIEQQSANFCDFGFAKLEFESSSLEEPKTYIPGGYSIKDEGDGYKKITLFGKDEDVSSDLSDQKEDYLFVIIPHALQIVTNSQKIAGRYSHEGIYVMQPGDTIEVSKSSFGPREVYMAEQLGNEIFLI